MYNFTITNDSITIIVDGKPVVVREGAANFHFLRNALINKDWASVPANLTAEKSLNDWLSAVDGFSAVGASVSYKGDVLPVNFTAKLHELVKRGESPVLLLNFHARLLNNPSARSVSQLWDFIGHCGIPLTEDGCFLAYKKVRDDFYDFHSGTVKNEVGTIVEMPRNKISDDPRQECHFGLHVGALKYAQNDFHSGTGRVIIVKVDPADVVSVPYDYSCQKMRVCKYEVFGHYNAPLDNLKHEEEAEDDSYGEVELELVVDNTLNQKLQKDGVTTVRKVQQKKSWKKYENMTMGQLLELPIAELRQYAGHGLKIVGASKIPGGKSALVKKILKFRK
jgi:hypothetical protein